MSIEDTREGVLEESLNFFFSSIPVSEFPKPHGGKVVVIRSDTLLRDAVKTLGDMKILAAPVLDTEAEDGAGW